MAQMQDLQGIPKTDHELKMVTCKVFWASLLLYHIFQVIDMGANLIVLLGEDC